MIERVSANDLKVGDTVSFTFSSSSTGADHCDTLEPAGTVVGIEPVTTGGRSDLRISLADGRAWTADIYTTVWRHLALEEESPR